ncbi:uncharacterized protein LOC131645257 [Vicia villosa]|uniref:uncharacterized protein LOC131645257 n=1 Tax=Vicia villosa TaxID=3911 RepID=UPI00273AD5B8|nr:uncharacterized protein LOC131645257 [Vicia villosa]
MGASIKNLEVQMSQIAQQLANAQPQGALPSGTITNPREHQNVNVISTRSLRRSKPEEKNETEYDDIIEVDLEVRENKKVLEEVIQPVKPTEEKREKELTPLIKLSYPSRVAKKDQKEQDFENFATYFKKLESNIPFFDALEKMPMYRKFMKEVISKKKPTRGEGVVKKEKCCAISPEKRIPIKQKDPGSAAIPCTIKNRTFMKVLIDSGASVSLMPLSTFKKLGIEKCFRVKLTVDSQLLVAGAISTIVRARVLSSFVFMLEGTNSVSLAKREPS